MSTTQTDKQTVELDPAARHWYAELVRVRTEISRLHEAEQHCRQQLEAVIGDADGASIDGQTVIHFGYVQSMRVDQKKLKEQAPDLYEALCRPVLTRPFKVADV